VVRALRKKGLVVVETAMDGNFMFRAVADQIYGDQGMHGEVRRQCLDYMEKERDHYSQFVTEGFKEYVARKRLDGTFGNHLELQSISEIYNRPIFIYTIDDKPLNMFQSAYDATKNPPIRLSYHFGNHYNSVRDPENPAVGVGLGLPGYNPEAYTKAEKNLMNQAMNSSERELLDDALTRSVIAESSRDEAEMQWNMMQFAVNKGSPKH